MMSDAEREYLAKHGPVKHAATKVLIERCLDFSFAVPVALCRCDDGHLCSAHSVAHYYAIKNQPERLERFVALVTRWRAKRV